MFPIHVAVRLVPDADRAGHWHDPVTDIVYSAPGFVPPSAEEAAAVNAEAERQAEIAVDDFAAKLLAKVEAEDAAEEARAASEKAAAEAVEADAAKSNK